MACRIRSGSLHNSSNRHARRLRKAVAIQFEGCSTVLPVTIMGSSIEVPVYVAEPVVDLRCCVYGKLYRKKLILKNRGKIAFKAIASTPPQLRGFIEVRARRRTNERTNERTRETKQKRFRDGVPRVRMDGPRLFTKNYEVQTVQRRPTRHARSLVESDVSWEGGKESDVPHTQERPSNDAARGAPPSLSLSSSGPTWASSSPAPTSRWGSSSGPTTRSSAAACRTRCPPRA